MALFSESSFAGVDIAATAVRLVQLRATREKPELVTYGTIPMPPGLFQSDSPLDAQNIANLVSQLAKKAGVKRVVAGLPGTAVYTTVVSVPVMSPRELAQAIRWQAEQHLPLALAEVKLDWSVLPHAEDAREMEVLLVAAPLAVVNKYVEIFDKAELELIALEVNPIAAARALVPLGEKPVAVIDVGALNTEIAMVEENVVRLARTVQIGGDALTRTVSKTLGIPQGQADEFKIRFGLLADKLEGQVYRALKPLLDSLVEEVKRSLKFYAEQRRGGQVEKIILTGGTSRMPDFPVFMRSALNREVVVGNPWEQVSYRSALGPQLTDLAAEFSVAVGLAARGMR